MFLSIRFSIVIHIMQSASIRSRLLVAFTALSLVVIVIGANLTYSVVKDVLYSELDHFLRDKLNYQQIAAAQVEDRVIFRLSEPYSRHVTGSKEKTSFSLDMLRMEEKFSSHRFCLIMLIYRK